MYEGFFDIMILRIQVESKTQKPKEKRICICMNFQMP